jgi:hypothetical protein
VPGMPGIGRQRQLEQEGGSLVPGLFLLLVHARLSLLICSSTLSRQTDGAGVTCKMPSCQFTPHLSTHSLAVSEKRQCPLISRSPVLTQMCQAPGSSLSHSTARVRFPPWHGPMWFHTTEGSSSPGCITGAFEPRSCNNYIFVLMAA